VGLDFFRFPCIFPSIPHYFASKKHIMVPTSDNLWQKMADGGMTFRSRSTELPYMNIPAGNAVDIGLMLHDSPDLWRGLWREGEMACLFADTNLGKSILAVQMGNDVAHRFKRNVLYFDFEHSIAQFARRYSINRKPFKFSPYFRRVNLREIYGPAPFGKEVVDGIERMVVDNRAAAIVIDNLTSVIGDVSNPRLVRRFIEQISVIKARYDLSILIVTHSKRHNAFAPLGVNHLACAPILSAFCDSIFAIGRSTVNPQAHYIKQIKSRTTEFRHGADSVIQASIGWHDYGLTFAIGDEAKESILIDRISPILWRQLQSAQAMSKSGVPIRQIAGTLGISKSSVHRLLHRYDVITVPDAEEQEAEENQPKNNKKSTKNPRNNPAEKEAKKETEKELGQSSQQQENEADNPTNIVPPDEPDLSQSAAESDEESEVETPATPATLRRNSKHKSKHRSKHRR
jgi:hypothetical protein